MMSQRPTTFARTGRDDPVLDAAMEAMTDLGPTRMTMAEVARRAGVSRMTVYRRYRSQGELVSAVLTAEMADVLAAVTAAGPENGTVRDRVVAQCVAVVTTLQDHTLLQRVLAVDPAALLPLLVDRLGSGQRLLREHLADALAAGMADRGGDGSIRDGAPRLMSLTLLTMAQQFVIGMRPLSEEYPLEVLLGELRTALDRYLRTE
jgi:AcrR family transcriptional regulator